MKAAGTLKTVKAPAGTSHYHQLANFSHGKKCYMVLCEKATKQIFVNKYWFDRKSDKLHFFTQRHVLKHKVPNRMSI